MSKPSAPLDPVTMLPTPAPEPERRLARRPRRDPALPLKQSHRLDGTLHSVCSLLGPKHLGPHILINLIRAIVPINPEAASFIALYDRQSSDLKVQRGPGIRARNNVTADILVDLCTEAQIPWPRLVGWAFEAAASTGQHLAAMKAALALPEVVDKIVQVAKTSKGYKDRELLARATGFLPTPSSNISIINSMAANAQANNSAAGGEMFVPFEQDVIDLDSPAPATPATSTEPEPVIIEDDRVLPESDQ